MKVFAGCITILSAFFMSLSILELISTFKEDPKLSPYGLDWEFFYHSVAHYKLRLVIGILLGLFAIWGAVAMWHGRRYSWILVIPFLLWWIIPSIIPPWRGYALW